MGYSCHEYGHTICKCASVFLHHLVTVHQFQTSMHRSAVKECFVTVLGQNARSKLPEVVRVRWLMRLEPLCTGLLSGLL